MKIDFLNATLRRQAVKRSLKFLSLFEKLTTTVSTIVVGSSSFSYPYSLHFLGSPDDSPINVSYYLIVRPVVCQSDRQRLYRMGSGQGRVEKFQVEINSYCESDDFTSPRPPHPQQFSFVRIKCTI